MLVLRTTAVDGAKAAVTTGFGICLGLFIWGFCAAVGLGVLLNASHLAYTLLRITGACYLVFLGCRMFGRFGRAETTRGSLDLKDEQVEISSRQFFSRGLFTNLLNPKVGVFYVSFLPLFIPAGVNVIAFSILLACIHVCEGIVWFALLIVAVQPLSLWLRRPSVENTLNRLTGLVFVGFGLRLLVEEK